MRGLFSCWLFRTIVLAVLCSGKGQQIYCPGDTVSLSCETAANLLWQGSALNGQCPTNAIVLQGMALSEENINDMFVCGDFTATLTNFAITVGLVNVTRLTSSLTVTASPSLIGTTVICSDGVNSVVTVQLVIPGAMSLVTQLSLTTANVSLSVGDDRCADMYVVEVTGGNSPTITVSNSSPEFEVDGLLFCRYVYSFVAYTQAPSGVQSTRTTLTPPDVSLADLSGVTNVRTISSTIEWDQPDSGLESQCITNYRLTWPAGGMYDTPDSSTSVSATQLNGVGFPYCQTVMVTVTPVTPVGVVTGGFGNTTAILHRPDFDGPLISASLTPLSGGMVLLTIEWQASVSMAAVPIRMYGYSRQGTECTPNINASSSDNSGTAVVEGAQPGDSFNVCVLFQNNECVAVNTSTVSVPTTLADPQSTAGDNSITVTVTLQSFPAQYTRNDLVIVSTIDPPRVSRIVNDYPPSAQQYTVTFTGLSPGVEYTYSIQVALRTDNTVAVGLPVAGTQAIPACGTSCIVGIVIAVVVVLLIIIIVIIIVVVAVVMAKKKEMGPVYEDPDEVKPDPITEGNMAYGHVQPQSSRGRQNRGTGQSSSQPSTELKQVGPIYEEPEDFKSDPTTQGNVAYGHVHYRK